MLYSQNKKYPVSLPFRIRLSDGSTRTDPSTFTQEEILDAGYVRVSEPPVIDSKQVLEWTGTEWNVRTKTILELMSDEVTFIDKEVIFGDHRINKFSIPGINLQASDENFELTGNITSQRFNSTIPTGIAPFSVSSTTQVANLRASTAASSNIVTNPLQPNITSVGKLISLEVDGDLVTTQITTGTNTKSGTFTGNWTLTSGSKLQSTQSDLAERYVSDFDYEPGTVVVFGGKNEVTISSLDTSLQLAGVVSSEPAFVLNSIIENSVIIALAGRVPCLVTGKVKKGDMLTVSNVPGRAMATSTVISGSMIGKAITEHDSDDLGKIEIQVWRS